MSGASGVEIWQQAVKRGVWEVRHFHGSSGKQGHLQHGRLWYNAAEENFFAMHIPHPSPGSDVRGSQSFASNLRFFSGYGEETISQPPCPLNWKGF